jgi:hypothetical protein
MMKLRLTGPTEVLAIATATAENRPVEEGKATSPKAASATNNHHNDTAVVSRNQTGKKSFSHEMSISMYLLIFFSPCFRKSS